MILIKLKYKFIIFLFFLLSASFIFSQNKEIELFKKYFSESQRFLLYDEDDTAKILLLKALKINPQSAAGNYAIAKIYFENQEYFLASDYAEKAVKFNDENLWYKRLLFDIYFQINDFQASTNIINEILKNSNKKTDYLSAINYFDNLNQYENTQKIAKEYIETYEFDFEIVEHLLTASYNLVDIKTIKKYNQKLIKKFPHNKEALILAAEFYWKIDNITKAKNILYQFYLIDNYNFYLNLQLSNIYFKLHNADSALFFIKKSLLSPQNNSVNVITVLDNNIEFIESQEFRQNLDSLLNELQIHFPENQQILLFIADRYNQLNRYYQAIEYYEKSLNTVSVNLDNYLKLLNLYAKFQYWKKLDSLSSEALKYFPAQPYLYLFQGIAILHSDNINIAYDALNYGLSITYDYASIKSYFNFYLSQYYRMKSNYSDENKYYNKALDLAENDCEIKAHFAYYFAKNNLYKDKSLNLIGSCIINDVKTLSPHISYVYSFVLYKFKDYNSALKYIDLAIENSKNHNFLYYELKANILNKQNKAKKAQKFWDLSQKYGNMHLNKNL